MPELHDLLHDHAGEVRDTDVAADLRRGHRALTRRRARFAGGTLAACAAATAAVVAWPGDRPDQRPDGAPVATEGPATPSATPEQTPPAGLLESDFMYYPDLGHGFTAARDEGASIIFTRNGAPAGSLLDSPTLYMSTPNQPQKFGGTVEYEGRTFYRQVGADAIRDHMWGISTELPDGWWVTLQVTDDAGLTEREVLDFLHHVEVKKGVHEGAAKR
ncbi:hypothetical protein [Nocardioides sp. GXZ039]|uniref:hypothetical protein n=1 Tax=Nocardioides sp. GXZ039 TaxID=3136018 RepID=UPI0030F3BAF2